MAYVESEQYARVVSMLASRARTCYRTLKPRNYF